MLCASPNVLVVYLFERIGAALEAKLKWFKCDFHNVACVERRLVEGQS